MPSKGLVRGARFAGSWYPGERSVLEEMLARLTPRGVEARRAIALVAPHAGYVYSGGVAAETYARVLVPEVAVVLCPNHRAPPPIVSVWPGGAWTTPLGEAKVDEALVERLLEECSAAGLVADTSAHAQEHAVELHVPFLQHRRAGVRIVPIVVAEDDRDSLRALGEGIARALGDRQDVLLVASTDMNHYESARVAERKDRLALDRVLALDPAGLLAVCEREDITMCGVRPTAAVLFASLALGATRAELVRHATSGDVSGDDSSVVGYAGVVVS